MRRPRPRNQGSRFIVVGVAVLLLAGCGSSSTASRTERATGAPNATAGASTTTLAPTPPTSSRAALAADAFDATDAQLDERVRAGGVPGGILRVVDADGVVIHEHSVGGVTGATVLDVASSSKWLTSATFMTFVDDGAIGLDDDISRWLPEFGGSVPPITPRQLMSHTSGVHDNPCQNGGGSLTACVQVLASSPREFAAGTQFSYGNAPFLIVGRLVEVLGGEDFATAVGRRITGPLGMDATTWPGAPGAANPAFGARTTADDYGRFLDMILHRGTIHGTRVLSASSVAEMLTDQVARYDTTHDYSVGITGIPRYGLGCWLDVEDGDAHATVASGNGGKGLYPWVDFTTNTWGIVGVQDERGAQYAVPASQQVELAARSALSR